MGGLAGLSAKESHLQQQRREDERELASDVAKMEGGLSRQLVLALPGALAADSLAQDAREAGGTMAPLMLVARAAVLTAQHRVVTHSG